MAYLEEEKEPDPLIIFDVLFILLVPGLVHPWVRDIHPDSLPVGGAQGVGGVDPAVSVKHLFRYFLGMNTHDGSTNILARCNDESEGQEDHHRYPVMQPENTAVRMESTDFH